MALAKARRILLGHSDTVSLGTSICTSTGNKSGYRRYFHEYQGIMFSLIRRERDETVRVEFDEIRRRQKFQSFHADVHFMVAHVRLPASLILCARNSEAALLPSALKIASL